MTSLVQFAGMLLVLGAATFAIAQAQPVRVETVAFEISEPLVLDQHRRAIGHLLRELPDLRRVELTLRDGFVADAASIRTLVLVQTMLAGSRAVLSIVAPAPAAASLLAHGLSAVSRTGDSLPVDEVA